jgi:hypothetical protein
MDKNELMYRLSNDDQIAKTLLSNDKKFLDYELKEGDKESLILTKIFPFPYTPDIPTTVMSFISMEFTYYKAKTGNKFKIGSVTFLPLCHKSLILNDYKDLRYDFLSNRIQAVMGGSRSESWLGTMELYRMGDTTLKGYIGMYLEYRNTEFN